ncbi:MAG: hypothetical protein HYT72_00890 [Candidatus Aenigmarchaeota archaeon]|nr:hypothetical protein [Candidatus Aenigmarchaeota archaeon]
MTTISDKISDVSQTQVITEGLAVTDFVDDAVLKELKDKFIKKYPDIHDVIPSLIQFNIIRKLPEPPTIDLSKDKKEGTLIIQLPILEFIRIEHPSKEHADRKKAVITTNRSIWLEHFLSK